MIKIEKINKNNYEDYMASDGSLYVLLRSSHAGYINYNNIAYLPQLTSNAIKTLTKKYKKPILFGHDESTVPLGRCIDGIASSNSPKSKANPDMLNKKKTSRKKEVSILSEYLYSLTDKEARNVDNSTNVLYTVARITKREAIMNIADGSYLSISIGATTDAMYCSICGQDWAHDGMCMHWPGEKDEDGKIMFFIAGELDILEQSFVNVPADPGAKIVAVLTEEEVNNKYYKEIDMKNVDSKNNDPTITPKQNVDLTHLQDELLDNKTAITVLDTEITDLKDKLELKESEITALKEEKESLNNVITELSDEVKKVLFAQIATYLKKMNKKYDDEFIKEKFGEKTVSQLRDAIEIMEIESDVEKIEKDPEKIANKEDETKLNDLEKLNVNDNFNSNDISIPANVRIFAAKMAHKYGAEEGQKILDDFLSEQNKNSKGDK